MNKFKLAYGAGVILLAGLCAVALGAVVLKAVGASPVAHLRDHRHRPAPGPVRHHRDPGAGGAADPGGPGHRHLLPQRHHQHRRRRPDADGHPGRHGHRPGAPGPAENRCCCPWSCWPGAIGGGLWAGIAGLLRARLGVNEILSTVMLNYIAAQFYTFLLRGPMIDPGRTGDGLGHAPVHAAAGERLAEPAHSRKPGCTPA